MHDVFDDYFRRNHRGRLQSRHTLHAPNKIEPHTSDKKTRGQTCRNKAAAQRVNGAGELPDFRVILSSRRLPHENGNPKAT